MTYDHYTQLRSMAERQIARRVAALQPRAGNNVSIIGDGISVDPIIRDGDEERAPPGWVFVILAVITADQNTTGLPENVGPFVAGIVTSNGLVADQTNFQVLSQVVELPDVGLYRRITTTLYPSTFYPDQIPDSTIYPPEPLTDTGIYRGALRITLELVDTLDVVYSTFTVDATAGGVTFATEAPTDDQFYDLRFVSAERL